MTDDGAPARPGSSEQGARSNPPETGTPPHSSWPEEDDRSGSGRPDIGAHPGIPIPGVQNILADARSLPIRDSSFRCVVASHLLPEFDDRGMHLVIAEASRVLARGGVFAFESLGRGDLREQKRKGEYRFMTAQEMLTVIGAHGLDPLEFDEDRIPVFYNGRSLERVYIHGVCRKR
jgi:SAM-dependent methyltransferase